jgi:choline-sulfatase
MRAEAARGNTAWRRWAAQALVVAVGLLAGAGCSGSGKRELPAVVLVTLDTFRADHLGCLGNPRVRTPHLDRLARGGVLWTEAVTPIPLTTPSHASILSGLSPRAHGVVKNRMVLGPDVETLPEILAANGVRTAAVVSSRVVLGPSLALDRGFNTYEVVDPEERPASGEGEETTQLALSWLEENGGPGSFLWVHYFDAHLPYLAPPPLDELYDPDYAGPWRRPREPIQAVFQEPEAVTNRDVEHIAALYAAEVTFVDHCVGELARELSANPRLAETILLVTADHGEGLYEHERYFGHDIQLYETSLRVPLLLAGAGAAGRDGGAVSAIVQEPARTLDVAPTILGLYGLPRGAAMEGRDLLVDPAPRGDAEQLVAETHPSREKAHALYALRTEQHKVIWKPRERRHEFYDLERDPGEREDLAAEGGKVFSALRGDLDIDLRTRPHGEPRTIDEERGGADDATREALRSLGYVD